MFTVGYHGDPFRESASYSFYSWPNTRPPHVGGVWQHGMTVEKARSPSSARFPNPAEHPAPTVTRQRKTNGAASESGAAPLSNMRSASASDVELAVVHAGQLDRLQVAGPGAALLEVGLLQACGDDALQLTFRRAGVVGVEQLLGVGGRQRLRDAAHAGVVGRAGRRGEPESGPGLDDDAAGGGRALFDSAADLGLPQAADLGVNLGVDGSGWGFTVAFEVALDGVLTDAEALATFRVLPRFLLGRNLMRAFVDRGGLRVRTCWAAWSRPSPILPIGSPIRLRRRRRRP